MMLAHQDRKRRPRASARYGVVFTVGTYDALEELPKLRRLMPKTMAVAVEQAIQYEQSFAHLGGAAHVLDLLTGEEIIFDRTYPFTIRGRCTMRTRRHFTMN